MNNHRSNCICAECEKQREETYNLAFSYRVDSDQELAKKGYKFLGAGTDKDGGEVHVFQKEALGKFQRRKRT